jgi:hypothetical protein
LQDFAFPYSAAMVGFRVWATIRLFHK